MDEEGGGKGKRRGKLEDEGKEQEGMRETEENQVLGEQGPLGSASRASLGPVHWHQRGKGMGDNKASEGP